MTKLKVLLIIFLISLSICAFANTKVKAQDLANFTVTGYPTSVNAGQSFGSVTVTAYDDTGAVMTDYSGAIYFTSTDSQAVLPYNVTNMYAFTSSDNGVHEFSGFTLNTNGPQTITVLDSLSVTTATTNSITVNPTLDNPTATANPTTVNQGQTSNLTSSAMTTGTPPYTYLWLEEAPKATSYSSISGATTPSYSFATTTATTTGNYSFMLQVIDSTDATVNSTAASVLVNSALAAPTLTANPAAVNEGQTSNLTSTAVSTGTSPYTYQWLQTSPSGSYTDVGTNSTSYSFATSSSTATGSWSFKLQVTDATGAAVNSTTVSVTVNSGPAVTVTPSSWTMDIGQNKTFTAAPTGGSGNYTSYQWYVDSALQSGQVNSTFTYVPASAGSHLINVMVTDSLGSSANSTAATVTVAASPTVNISPTGPVTKDVGQIQTFSATTTGGTGSLTYQWFLDGVSAGSNNASYSYTASTAGAHSVTCKVTDSASTPVTSPASNAISVTVNAALVPATVTANPTIVSQGQTSSLTSSPASGGTAPYVYQWFESAPGGSYASVGSGASSFSFVTSNATATGFWRFILQVTDSAGASANSSVLSISVNSASLSQFVFSPIGTQTAGTSFTITITAKDEYGNTITNYTGINTLSVSTGTISPTSTVAFSGGVWTGLVTLTGAGSGTTLFTSSSGMTGTSSSFTVNPGALNHFTFSTIANPQTAYYSFSVTVTAEDKYGNTVTSYGGTPSLTYSAGAINPNVMSAFVNGVGSTIVSMTAASSGATITATDGTCIGVSNTFAVDPTISVSTDGNGAVSPTGTFAVNYGSNQSFIITPNVGYYIDEVMFNGVSVGSTSPVRFNRRYGFMLNLHIVHTNSTLIHSSDLNHVAYALTNRHPSPHTNSHTNACPNNQAFHVPVRSSSFNANASTNGNSINDSETINCANTNSISNVTSSNFCGYSCHSCGNSGCNCVCNRKKGKS